MLEARAVSCVRSERTLFRDLDLSLAPGELLHVTGANGSGKTSLLRILCGLLPPVEGIVRWRGTDIRMLREDYRRELLYIGHASSLKDDLTPAENLAIACAIACIEVRQPAIDSALECFGIAECAMLPVRMLSQGQRRRSALARLVLSHTAALWILDEPFTALDSSATERLAILIAAHLASGGLVVLTSHQPLAALTECARRVDL